MISAIKKPVWILTAIGVCIVPVYLIYKNNLSYAWSMVVLFWFTSGLMLLLHTRWMYRRNLIIPFLMVNFLLAIVACYFEFAAIGLNIWSFSETCHKLLRTITKNPGLPYAIYEVPIEEFLFWCEIIFRYCR